MNTRRKRESSQWDWDLSTLESLFSYQTLNFGSKSPFLFPIQRRRGDASYFAIPWQLSLYHNVEFCNSGRSVTPLQWIIIHVPNLYLYCKKIIDFHVLDRVEIWIVKTSPFYPGKCNVYGEVVKENCFMHIFFILFVVLFCIPKNMTSTVFYIFM